VHVGEVLVPLVGDRVQRVTLEPNCSPLTLMLRPEAQVVPEDNPLIGVASNVFWT